ncbi:MAG: exosortase family protein XrtF, partial [Flavobacteriaceae bacterium]|nr:exosortase family protein XrtF [Flavobacteriaceae bacterium]
MKQSPIYRILRFVVLFLGIYFLMSLFYWLYLSRFEAQPDGITKLVTIATVKAINFFGYEAGMALKGNPAEYYVYVNQASVVRIIEGCNAMSLMVLFIAFTVAVPNLNRIDRYYKKLAFFVVLGVASIVIINIIRIVLLTILLYHFPDQVVLLHEILFPL